MDTGRLCMFCMEDNEGQSICPHCGKDANAPLIKNHLKPGEILGLTKTGLRIACGEGAVEIISLQAEGGKRMAAPDYFRGHPLER